MPEIASSFKLEYETKVQTVAEDFEAAGVIIVAAGSASRMGGINKILTPILGVPVIARTVSAFQNHTSVTKIVIVTSENMLADISRIVGEYNLTKVSDTVLGGATRKESVIKGFNALIAAGDIKTVLIQDGARPLVTAEVIDNVLIGVRSFGAAVPTVPVKDTVKIIGALGKIESTPKRENLAAAQTPQGFRIELYKKALDKMEPDREYTDDSSIAESAGITVYSVKGDPKNIKITTPEDLRVAESFLEGR